MRFPVKRKAFAKALPTGAGQGARMRDWRWLLLGLVLELEALYVFWRLALELVTG